MTLKLNWANRRQTLYFAGYSVLLLFGLRGLIVQGGVWLTVGLTSLLCCCFVIFGLFEYINYRYHSKCLNDVSLDTEAISGRRSQSR
jgi:hypothetical protein